MFDVITIGTATRDVVLRSPLFKVLRDPAHLKKIGFITGEAECFALGSKIDIDEIVFTTGGGATNSAVTFAKQGLKTAALITIGGDSSGEDVLRDLKKSGVHSLPVRRKGGRTAYSTILLSPTGERTILSYRNAEDNLAKSDISFSKLTSRWVYLAPGTIDLETLLALAKHFARRKTYLAVNPSRHFIETGVKKLKPFLDHVKALIMNREEAAYLTGVPYGKEEKIFVKLHELAPGIAVMTDGPKGVLVSDGFNLYRAGIFKEKQVADRTGAGDAFDAAFVAGLIQTKEECRLGLCEPRNIKYAIRLASANATSKVENVGAKGGLLTKKEFLESPRWRDFPITVTPL